MINNLVGGLFGKIVDNAEGILDKVITTEEEVYYCIYFSTHRTKYRRDETNFKLS